MATTRPDTVGKIRYLLAELLEAVIPTVTFLPEDLNSQIPIYANPIWDCCSWYGTGKDKETGLGVRVSSWDTMTKCVRNGIEVTQDRDSSFVWDIFSRDAAPWPKK